MLDTLPYAPDTQAKTRFASSARTHSRKPSWKAAGQFDRLGAAYEVMQARGAKTFTLRLGPDALERVTVSADPARVMSRRIARAFERAGVQVPFLAFSLEVTPNERNQLHLHGAIDLSGISEDLAKDILRDAADRIEGRAGSRQIKIKPFDMNKGGPMGWANYTRRGYARTRRVLGQERVTYMPDLLRRLARTSWDGSRQIKSVTHLH
ncbi:MAG: hypothetical protein RLP98_09520 [Devosia sp.]